MESSLDTMDTETERLMAFIAETLDMPTSSIELDSDLLQSGRLDSLAIVSLVAFLEDELGVRLAVDQLVPQNFSSARQIVALVQAARG
jgi:acyl carrier protein